MRLLLDTATLIYAVEAPEKLSKRASAALRNPGNVLELSTISLSEIAIKQSLGKLKVTAAIVRHAQALSEKISVVTPDEKFRLYGGLKITW